MQTVRELYNQSIKFKETILIEIIELLVMEKEVLSLDDTVQHMFEKFLTPKSEEHKERLNRRYRECLEEMRKKRGTVRY